VFPESKQVTLAAEDAAGT